MKRPFLALVVASVLFTPLVLADDLADKVRQATERSYVHGINQEVADRELGPEAVPYLLDLLSDPDFERRDNVVAFLVYLASDRESSALMDLLDNPPTDADTPEEFRARLMVPEALGRIASKGGTIAAELLAIMERDPAIREQRGLAQQVDYGIRLMTQTADAEEVWYPDLDEDEPNAPLVDPYNFSHLLPITFANHADVNSPMSRDRLDEALEHVTGVLNTDNGANDTACCIKLERSGAAKVFGTSGDGLDIINSQSKLNQVINNSTARVKVVDYIGYCGGPGSGILGCGQTPGDGLVVVRMSTAPDEGKLWAHELGHNTGLPHNSTWGFLMYGSFSSSATRLSSSECTRYHFPFGAYGTPPTQFGDCHDDDADGVVSTTDNCPNDSNPNQANSDEDEYGDACDNCPDDTNPDQADCDNDGLGDVCDSQQLPPPVGDLTFTLKTRFEWPAIFHDKNIYRGSIPPGGPFTYNEVLLGVAPVFGNLWTDTEVPESGEVYWYEVKTYNGCGESE